MIHFVLHFSKLHQVCCQSLPTYDSMTLLSKIWLMFLMINTELMTEVVIHQVSVVIIFIND